MKDDSLGNQKGIALVMALLMLLVLTIIGVSSISSSVFEAKLSGNERVGSAAFYASEAGVMVGIDRLPNLTAYSGNVDSDGRYRSGEMIPSTPQPLKKLGVMSRPGYDTTWQFDRVQVNATGESYGAMKEVEVQLTLGPYGAGTQYNN